MKGSRIQYKITRKKLIQIIKKFNQKNHMNLMMKLMVILKMNS